MTETASDSRLLSDLSRALRSQLSYQRGVVVDKGVTMKRLVLLLPVVLLVLNVSLPQADTIHVPSGQPTIQAGIDAAVDGDTVLVADGTYTGDGNRDIDFLGKAIVVMSEHGAFNCVIDCEGGSWPNFHRGFIFHQGETNATVLQGFTITGGRVDLSRNGGGIVCEYSSPTVRNNIIADNFVGEWGLGAGIYLVGSSSIIHGNIIKENFSAWKGGGIHCSQSSLTIEQNLIFENYASSAGGGISCSGEPSPILSRNTIVENRIIVGYGEGGGIYCTGSSPTIVSCIIRNNQGEEIAWHSLEPEISYSNVQGGWPGKGNINKNPLFVLSDSKDYRLLWGSPCIDTGHPDSLDEDGTRSDMGAHYFNQNDFITLYVTPDTTEVVPGDQLGVTFTAINRWENPESFWVLSRVLRPGGSPLNVLGPDQYTLPANYTAQVHITHPIPYMAHTGMYEYRSLIGMPPGTLYDSDSFKFWVIE